MSFFTCTAQADNTHSPGPCMLGSLAGRAAVCQASSRTHVCARCLCACGKLPCNETRICSCRTHSLRGSSSCLRLTLLHGQETRAPGPLRAGFKAFDTARVKAAVQHHARVECSPPQVTDSSAKASGQRMRRCTQSRAAPHSLTEQLSHGDDIS